jgi:hypothetical protein
VFCVKSRFLVKSRCTNKSQTYRQAWHYAHTFTTTVSGPPAESHIAALHSSLIPNWTSAAFVKFVDACRGLVDELAVDPALINGKQEMERCEAVFRQVCWLTSQAWPVVDSMGDENSDSHQLSATAAAANAAASSDEESSGFLNGTGESSGAVA